jgi:hypothetical protein
MHIYQLLFYAAAASAKLHHFFVGTFTEGHLYGIEFDEAALTLKVIMNLTVAEPHLWLELDVLIPPFQIEPRSPTQTAPKKEPLYRLWNKLDLLHNPQHIPCFSLQHNPHWRPL